jgi:hypothetical protein
MTAPIVNLVRGNLDPQRLRGYASSGLSIRFELSPEQSKLLAERLAIADKYSALLKEALGREVRAKAYYRQGLMWFAGSFAVSVVLAVLAVAS